MAHKHIPFKADVLRNLRQRARLSTTELANRASVHRTLIGQYESGKKIPSKASLLRLASALNVAPQVLMGITSGSETLANLREMAGKNKRSVCEVLLGKVPGVSCQAIEYRLSCVERGEEAYDWKDQATVKKLTELLANEYGVDRDAVRAAWLRAFPQHAAFFVDREPVQASRTSSSKSEGHPLAVAAARTWDELNDRQRAYLVVLYRTDQDVEADVQARSAAIWKRPVPASEWRKLPFTIQADPSFTGYTKIQEALRAEGELDSGAGSTLSALERRGLIEISEDQVEVFPLGLVPRTLVTLTRRGRACARAGLGEASSRRPPHLLSEWLWSNLVKVAAAGEEGLPVGDLWGKSKFYIGTGYQPTRKEGVQSRGYIGIVDVWDGEGPDAYVVDRRWKLTDAGRAHIAEHLAVYRNLYPEVDTTGICDPIG